jgi:REP element-mobilizing transposase RayT
MSKKFLNKYRIASARLQSWNYGWAGAYFITICTANRKHYFGHIEKGKMQLSPIGQIADMLWHEIPNHSKNAALHAFVVMPNHIHGILILTANGEIESGEKIIGQKRFQNIGKNSVSAIIGSYKSAVTKYARRLGYDFQWQSRFHDHIIRNDNEFQRIARYINANPENWKSDNFFKGDKIQV